MADVYFVVFVFLAVFTTGVIAISEDKLDSHCYCYSNWTHVATTNPLGTATFGTKAELITMAMQGYEFRVLINNFEYATSLQSLQTIGDNLCAQALFSISKGSYSTFQPNVYWWFLNLCTTGQVQMTRYYVGAYSFISTDKVQYSIKWFAKPAGRVLYHNTNGGSALNGNVNDLIASINNGASVRNVITRLGFAAPMDNIQVTAYGDVVGQSIWSVSQRVAPPNLEFQGNDYWWMTDWATDGTLAMTRWNIGDHVNRGNDDAAHEMIWYADTCWQLAYSHDEEGNEIQGSLEFLRAAVERGHRLKVMFAGISVEPDQIRIRGGHVTAMILSNVLKDGSNRKLFAAEGVWDWCLMSTTGTYRSLRLQLGAAVETSGSRVTSKRAAVWFIDTRSWIKVLAHSKTGVVTFGSKGTLLDAVGHGARVRYIMQFGTDDNSIQEADNVAINNENIGAMHVRSVSITPASSSSEYEFQSRPYWWFTIAASTGDVAMSRWTVGEHESRGNTGRQADIQWFVNY